MHIWSILLASGQGSRIGGQKTKKQFLPWKDRPLFWHSVLALAAHPAMQGMVITFPPDELEQRKLELLDLWPADDPGVEYICCSGGSSRQESVANALAFLPFSCSHVLVHDAARPFLHPRLVHRIVESLDAGAEGAVPALQVTDTIKERRDENRVHTLDRSQLFAVQTPQGFKRSILSQAHAQAASTGWQGTDDASLIEEMGCTLALVPGQEDNIKITTNQDLEMLQEKQERTSRACIGWGYDVHRFGPGRPMKLGGIPIANGPEITAHSDGDVLLHALVDAILGCLGQGDIGEHFPDSDPGYDNISSGVLLAKTLDLAAHNGLHIEHVDLTIITQVPKIGPWKAQITKNVHALLGLSPQQVNLKATTEEGLGFTGSKQGIKAVAQVIGHTKTKTKDQA